MIANPRTQSGLLLPALLAALIPTALILPAPAYASTPTIDFMLCTSRRGWFDCSATYTSTTPASAVWQGGANGVSGDDPGMTFYQGTCTPGTGFAATVTITNASGSTSGSRTVDCRF